NPQGAPRRAARQAPATSTLAVKARAGWTHAREEASLRGTLRGTCRRNAQDGQQTACAAARVWSFPPPFTRYAKKGRPKPPLLSFTPPAAGCFAFWPCPPRYDRSVPRRLPAEELPQARQLLPHLRATIGNRLEAILLR